MPQNFDISKRKPWRGPWSADCDDFEKGEGKYFLSKQEIYNMQD